MFNVIITKGPAIIMNPWCAIKYESKLSFPVDKNQTDRAKALSRVADLLEKRSEGFVRAEILDQGRAIQGACKDDNDVAREVIGMKYFLSEAVATVESATRTTGNAALGWHVLKTYYTRGVMLTMLDPIQSEPNSQLTLTITFSKYPIV